MLSLWWSPIVLKDMKHHHPKRSVVQIWVSCSGLRDLHDFTSISQLSDRLVWVLDGGLPFWGTMLVVKLKSPLYVSKAFLTLLWQQKKWSRMIRFADTKTFILWKSYSYHSLTSFCFRIIPTALKAFATKIFFTIIQFENTFLSVCYSVYPAFKPDQERNKLQYPSKNLNYGH